MELCEGNLKEFITIHRGTLTETQIKDIVTQVTAALVFMHDRGIAHRDIKPANILVKGDVFKVADFGLSKFGPDFKSWVGTPLYIAPEIKASRSFWNSYDCKVDVWSLGVLICECFLGSRKLFTLYDTGKYKQLIKEVRAKHASQNMLNLLVEMLEVNPHFRCSMIICTATPISTCKFQHYFLFWL